MRIKRISVSGLFGIFDHVIPLNMGERITIIHGPNGFGKTAVLRILSGLFNSRYSELRSIPFGNFRVEFDNGSVFEAIKSSNNLEKAEKDNIVFAFCEPNLEKVSFTLENIRNRFDIDLSIGVLDELIPDLRRMIPKAWRYVPTGETFSLEEVIDRFEDLLPSNMRLREEPEWLEKLRNTIHIRLIESQSLLNIVPSRSSRTYYAKPSMLPTVSAYSDELAKLMRDKFTEYGTTSQSLDRTFPVRVVKQQPSPDLTDEQLRHQLNELEQTRSRLIEVGLLNKDENSDFQIQPQAIDESTRNILSVYIEDVEKKLRVFNEIASKIDLLKRIINDKFAYLLIPIRKHISARKKGLFSPRAIIPHRLIQKTFYQLIYPLESNMS